MTEEQWKEAITPTAFSVTNNYNEGIYDVDIKVNGNSFHKRFEFDNNGNYGESEKTYVKKSDGSYQVSYRNATQYYKWDTETTSEEDYQNAYNENVAPFVELLTYVENNYDKFTYISSNEDGMPIEEYEFVVAGSEIEEKVVAVKEVMNVSNIETKKIVAVNFDDGLSVRFVNDDNPYVVNLWFEYPAFESVYALGNVTNYTIEAGVNTADDYCVTKVTEEGFMQYYPNQTDGVGNSAVCAKQITEGQYVGEYQVYARQGASWVAGTPQTPDYYKEYTFDTYVSKYFYDVTAQFNLVNTDLYEMMPNGIKFKENHTFTFTCRRWTHTYKDLTIMVNDDFEIVSISLQVSTHDSATNTDSAFVPVTITVGNTTIDFPQS